MLCADNKLNGACTTTMYFAKGNASSAISNDKATAMSTTSVVSENTCQRNCARLLPITLRTPTSLLLVTANAVEINKIDTCHQNNKQPHEGKRIKDVTAGYMVVIVFKTLVEMYVLSG